jgi:Protein of unknown function (DUF3467)
MAEEPEGGEATEPVTITINQRNPGGVYANGCIVAVTPEEAVLRFVQRDPNDPTELLGVGTVFMSLSHAKRLFMALGSSIRKYERDYGEIPIEPQRISEQRQGSLEIDEQSSG